MRSMNENRRIIKVLIAVSFLFVAMLTYLMYFNLFVADEVLDKKLESQQWETKSFQNRGKIYERKGELIAETVTENDETKRVYPYGRLFSHVVGYCVRYKGTYHLEKMYNDELVAGDRNMVFQNVNVQGKDLTLTINADFQQYVYDRLKGKKGAIVALAPKTGEVLAMVSLPDFDPETIGENMESQEDFLYARAFNWTYPPGSTFKILTAAAAYENGMQGKMFNDTGGFEKGELKIPNAGGKAYGEISLEDGFRVSSNQVFGEVAYELGPEKMQDIAKRFGLDTKMGGDIQMKMSTVGYKDKKMFNTDCPNVGIGQGEVEVTPLHMAMICATIANDGKMMQPYLVKEISYAGKSVGKAKPKEIGQPITKDCADYIGDMMIDVVESGTGTRAQISNVTVAGKTGTAENSGDDHAWFVGYAPAENPQIAVAVVLENDGTSGGGAAAPIASRVMNEYLENYGIK